jgi:uncharacterized RDD family membrane protein YckC
MRAFKLTIIKYKKRNEILTESELTIAPYSRRLLSFLFDGIIICLIYVFLQLLFQFLGFQVLAINVENFTHVVFVSANLGNTSKFIIKWILISIPTLYFTLTTFFFDGQTIGKKIFKIQIISLYHKKIGFWHCLERSLGYVASTLEFGLGFVQAVWNNNRMTLHDKIAETIVINKTSYK